MDVGDVAGNALLRSTLGDSFPASPRVTLRLAEEAGVDENSNLLHLGCGVGTVCQILIGTYGCKATGIVEMEELLQHATFDDERVQYIHAPLSNPPFVPHSFTHVLIEARCIIFSDLSSILEAAKMMLAPNGVLMINDLVMGGGQSLPPMLGKMMGDTTGNGVLTFRDETEISNEVLKAGFSIDVCREEPEVTNRILAKLNQISMMLKMALRLSGFNPKSHGIPFTTKEIIAAFNEIKKGIDDGTFQWFSWQATVN
ncbi:MAG: class I SAM-dependent methyltransferase [Candidatus Thalassarchaeaceae archaeon]|jgi:hypothetical protein|nr:class I SAM-dependent methyltransferase [Candidatus Thalassarchaeaceae archaeon]